MGLIRNKIENSPSLLLVMGLISRRDFDQSMELN